MAGWCYSWIARLSWARDFWTALLNVRLDDVPQPLGHQRPTQPFPSPDSAAR